MKPEDTADLQSRQVAILGHALAQLAPDGLLVYSTCSLEREENQDVVAMAGATVRDPGDGFFAALLRLN